MSFKLLLVVTRQSASYIIINEAVFGFLHLLEAVVIFQKVNFQPADFLIRKIAEQKVTPGSLLNTVAHL
jgi:hypothetical protein